MNIKIILLVVIAVAAFAGCAKSEGPYAHQSSKWYYDHAKNETAAEVKWCQNQPGASKIQSCVDAATALQKFKFDAWVKTPPSHGW